MDDTTDPEFFIFTCRRSAAAFGDSNASIAVQYGSTLGGWATAVAGSDILINAAVNGAASWR